MSIRSFTIDKWVQSDEDFREMNWHDVLIHGLTASNEMLSEPDEEPRSKPRELFFDIDYVLNWKEALVEHKEGCWISPATLVFFEVSDVKANFESKSGLLWIYNVLRKDRLWTIALDTGLIEFASAGFKQYLRRKPIFKSRFTSLSDSERGGFSFRCARD